MKDFSEKAAAVEPERQPQAMGDVLRDVTATRYLGNDYGQANPTWDVEDAPWKVEQVVRMLQRHQIAPTSIAEIGCGAGAILAGLRGYFPDAALYGFDIAPGAAGLWSRHASARIEFTLGDFFQRSHRRYDLLLVLDVIEHLANPFDFLSRLRGHAEHSLFHIPLDLSAVSVLREQPLLHVRAKVGHLHYYTKGLALTMLKEAGHHVVDSCYTGAGFTAPRRGWLGKIASLPRRIVQAIAKDAGVRLLGGETLMILTRHGEMP
jgi:SAM-dependent methyltransferase